MPFPTSSFVRNGKYVLLQHQPVGRGGVGQVYHAREVALNREVAVKEIIAHRGPEQQELAREKLVHEASIHGNLSHSQIVKAHTFETDPTTGEQYLVCDFIAGGSLAAYIKHRPLSEDEAIILTIDLLDALAYLHHQGIVHRDIKPSNILITYNAQRDRMEALLTDFGIARRMHDTLSALDTNDLPSLTPEYCAPEQYLAGQHSDPRSDLYALGLVLGEMVCGGGPYKLRKQSPPQTALHGNTRLARVIDRAIERAPDKRFQTAVTFKAALEQRRIRRTSSRFASAGYQLRPGRMLAILSIILLFASLPLLDGMPFFNIEQPLPTKSAATALIVASSERPQILVFLPEATPSTTPPRPTSTPFPLPVVGMQRIAPSLTTAPTAQPIVESFPAEATVLPDATPLSLTKPMVLETPQPSAIAQEAEPPPTQTLDLIVPSPTIPPEVVPW